MKRIKIICVLLVFMISTSALAGCGKKSESVQEPEKVEDVLNEDLSVEEEQTESAVDDEQAYDEELTTDVKSWMEERCGGEWGAEWYPDIIDIKMFSRDGKKWAVIVSNAEGEETNKIIAETVMQYETWIDTAFVHDSDGNELYLGQNPFNKEAYK